MGSQYYRWLTISDQQMIGVLFCALLAAIGVIWLLTARYCFPALLPVVSIALAVIFYTIALFFSGGLTLAYSFNCSLLVLGLTIALLGYLKEIMGDPRLGGFIP